MPVPLSINADASLSGVRVTTPPDNTVNRVITILCSLHKATFTTLHYLYKGRHAFYLFNYFHCFCSLNRDFCWRQQAETLCELKTEF